MEDLEFINVSTDELLKNSSYDETLVETTQIDDLESTTSSKIVPTNNYTEVEAYDTHMVDTNSNAPSSSVLPLCITIVVCLIAGVALGIFSAKKNVNKSNV